MPGVLIGGQMTRSKAYWQGVEEFGKHVKLTGDLVAILGISAMAIRRSAARRNLGTRVGDLLVFTPADVQAMIERKDRRTKAGRE